MAWGNLHLGADGKELKDHISRGGFYVTIQSVGSRSGFAAQALVGNIPTQGDRHHTY